MPIDVSWFTENCIIEAKFRGDVTIEDIESGAHKIADLLNQSEHAPIHVIHHYGMMTNFPKSIKLISTVSRV